MVLPERIELSTSPLPRECSTTELRQRRRGLISVPMPPVNGRKRHCQPAGLSTGGLRCCRRFSLTRCPLPQKRLLQRIFQKTKMSTNRLQTRGPKNLHVCGRSTRNKSLFASFSSEKEEVFFFEKKNQKTFISSGAGLEDFA